MPKMKPDRDDRQGNMAGQGGPQCVCLAGEAAQTES